MMKLRTALLTVFLVLSTTSEVLAQIEMNIFDFDGTLVEHRQSRKGSFNAKFIIYRIHQRLNLLQNQATGPEEITITQQDLHRMKEHLGTGEGRPGSIGREVELIDGTRVQPADYYLRYPDSYRYFREGPAGENRLLQTFKDAEKLAVGAEWRGPMWNLFADLCATQASANTVAIITARGHSRSEWAELFQYMKQKKYIRFSPDPDMVYNITRPEFDTHSRHGGAYGSDPVNVPERKATLIREILTALKRVDPGPGKRHSVMFAEDDQQNLNRVAQVFREIAFGDYSPVRMTLVNAGLVNEVRDSDRPEVSYIEPGSKTFQPLPRDNFFRQSSTTTVKAPTSRARTCEALFSRSI